MTRAGRVLLGATLGAVLSLVIHPASRPYLFSAFISPSRKDSPKHPGIPDNVVELSDWMTAVGDRFSARATLSSTELQNAIDAADRASRLDRDNAYWRQMLAALNHQLNREQEARRHWFAAAACATWNDYQSTELLRERERLAAEFGSAESWQLAYVYYQRSDSAVHMISQYARSLIMSTSLANIDGLLGRAVSVVNGGLLSAGSRNIRIGNHGIEIAESACHPPGMAASLTRHKLFLARIDLHNRLIAVGRTTLADQVNHVYREADAWNAMENSEEAGDEISSLSFESLLLVGIPSAMLVVGACGLAIWLLGAGVRRLDHIHWIPATVVGALLGLGAYSITLLPLAAVSTLLCCAFLTLGPKRERRIQANDLGPMFHFCAGTLALVFALLVTAFVIGIMAPAVSLLPSLDVPHEYFGGSSVLLGLSIIVMAILLLLAPMFAIALRVGTALVLSAGLKYFGAFLSYLALATIVIGTPLCIYEDRQNAEPLHRIVTNEPVYYLTLPR